MPFLLYTKNKGYFIFHLYCCWTLTATSWSAAWFHRDTPQRYNILISRRRVPLLSRSPQEESKSLFGNIFEVPKRNKSNDPLEGTTLSAMEEYFAKRGESITNTSVVDDNSKYDEVQRDTDGVWLDTDSYTSSRYFINPDGSLDLPESEKKLMIDYERVLENIAQMNPKVPEQYYGTHSNPSINEVWTIVQSQDLSFLKNQTSEELHKQVFENEQGYFQNSQIFLQSLTDESKADQARALRHQARYRERQAAAIQSLEEQMNAFEKELNLNEYTGPKCSKCNSVLFKEETVAPNRPLCQLCRAQMLRAQNRMEKRFVPTAAIAKRQEMMRQRSQGLTRSPQLSSTSLSFEQRREVQIRSLQTPSVIGPQGNVNETPDVTNVAQLPITPPSRDNVEQDDENPWVEVEDPDTGEIFYWNRETEEMKWEI